MGFLYKVGRRGKRHGLRHELGIRCSDVSPAWVSPQNAAFCTLWLAKPGPKKNRGKSLISPSSMITRKWLAYQCWLGII
jgi:hypothetical protein